MKPKVGTPGMSVLVIHCIAKLNGHPQLCGKVEPESHCAKSIKRLTFNRCLVFFFLGHSFFDIDIIMCYLPYWPDVDVLPIFRIHFKGIISKTKKNDK